MRGDLILNPASSDEELLRILFRGKWRLRVVRLVLERSRRLSELRRLIPDCSKKVLIDTLRDLEDLGLLKREDLSASLRRVEYQIEAAFAERIAILLGRLDQP